ncbi:PadR family transcriptional regulator [Micromonospora sp. LOL_025]|uniref:PadR family transcriptional regulator n=1 Tax=Micromonospora sp. LOL_025 TaxID=3345413 RepID=UPI003A8A516C
MDTPLREPTFWILAALAGPPPHGYGIIRTAATVSEGRLSMRPGTLYGAPDRLAEAGLIEVDRAEVVGGRLRRYYRLSATGNATLAGAADRLRRNVEAATASRSNLAIRPRNGHSRALGVRQSRLDGVATGALSGKIDRPQPVMIRWTEPDSAGQTTTAPDQHSCWSGAVGAPGGG